MFTAEAAEAIFPHVSVQGWAFDVEVLCLARRFGLRLVEVPIEWHHSADSRVSALRDSGRMLADLFRIRARVRRVAPHRRP
jgi:dolichyl-phosphate beta-glucosyltransferase